MIENIRIHGPRGVISGLFYGFGLVLGGFLSSFLFRIVTLDSIAHLNDAVRLLIGILLAFVINGLGGAVGGFTGGYSLPLIDQTRGRWGNAWRSAFSIGLPYGLSLYPIILVFSLFAFFTVEVPYTGVSIAIMLVAAVFGVLASLLMGMLVIGRRGISRLVWAGILGFAVGGAILGSCLWAYLFSIRSGGVNSGQWLWVVIGLFAFGLVGGGAWGYVFARLVGLERSPIRRGFSWRRFAVMSVVLILLVIILRPVFAAVGDLLTPQSAGLGTVLDSGTKGVHWSEPVKLTESEVGQPAISAAGEQVGITWNHGNTILFTLGEWDRLDNETRWAPAAEVSSGDNAAEKPQIVVDRNGNTYVVWIEGESVLVSVCEDGACSEPANLSRRAGQSCVDGASKPLNVTLAIVDDGNLLVVWQVENGTLLFGTWPAGAMPAEIDGGCVPTNGDVARLPRLAAAQNGRFLLIYQTGESEAGDIFVIGYSDGEWGAAEKSGFGELPSIYVDASAQSHAAWCGDEGQVTYWTAGISESVANLPCLSRPELAEDSSGNVHVAWYSNEVENNAGHIGTAQVLYESVKGETGWETPSIVSLVEEAIQPVMSESGGDLHLAWAGSEDLKYASQIQYDCDEFELTGIGQAVFDIARLPKYRPQSDVVPYCRNRFDRLIYTPNPKPEYSEEPTSLNGGFDRLAEIAEAAEYEILFSNMWYDADAGGDSPGRILADSVAALYAKLQANPEQYPRGMTVRILLGNPPEVARGEFAGQIWHVLGDLRSAGVPEMQKEELGWSVEVANFEGTLPHSHIKSMIVDGKTAVAAGFNMSYEHFEADHPSGLGNDRFDLGMQVTGPVAQDARVMFDDLWEGANRLHCKDFYPSVVPWQSTCLPKPATSSHATEVLKYYLTSGDSTAFSMYRTEAHNEADGQGIAALASAQESIDVIHVNFTMEMVCDLNLLYDQVCTKDQLLPYMDAILDAAENNGVQVRILIKGAPIDGIESSVHLAVLQQEVVTRGLTDQVEARLFDGPMHPKSALIDNEFLIIGSQNYHYSAFGEQSGLAEYSLGVIDPQAAGEFERLFEYQWERAEPINN